MKGFSLLRTAVKVDVIGRKICCLQTRPCIFPPENFAGWGSEGVNILIPLKTFSLFLSALNTRVCNFLMSAPVLCVPVTDSLTNTMQPFSCCFLSLRVPHSSARCTLKQCVTFSVGSVMHRFSCFIYVGFIWTKNSQYNTRFAIVQESIFRNPRIDQ